MSHHYPNHERAPVYRRGNIGRFEKAPVHYQHSGPYAVLPSQDRPLCHNGSWHLFWTKNHARVTCPVCLEILQGKQAR